MPRTLTAVSAALFAALLCSCAGKDGANGAPGTNGQNGAPGANGADGQNGAQGSPGATGANGATGPAGDAGVNGQNGQNGLGFSTGVDVTINGVTVAANGTVSVDFNLADDQGGPLDNQGVWSQGVAAPRFGLGRLDTPAAGAPVQQYITLTRSGTSPGLLNTANPNTGTVAEVTPRSGHYIYTFPSSVQIASSSLHSTHTIFVQIQRQLDPLDPSTKYVQNVTWDFVPDGTKAVVTREVVTTKACNQCHDPLAQHGGGRREAKLCGACHQAELSSVTASVNGVVFNDLSLPNFAHAIHAGTTFPNELRNCDMCHAGAAQGGQITTNSSQQACTGCHSWLRFDGSGTSTCSINGSWGVVAIPPSGQCSLCHDATLDHAEPDAFWNLANNPPTLPLNSGRNPVVKTTINAVSFDASRVPTFTFTVTTSYNGGPDQPRNLATNPLKTFRISWATSLAGATAVEYVNVASSQSWNIPGYAGTTGTPPAPVSGTPGQYTWTAPTAVPAADRNSAAFPVTQTFAFAMETADGDSTAGVEVRGITSPVFFWRLDNQNSGSNKPLSRRLLVDGAKCNVCHGAPNLQIGFGFHHAGSRNNVQECAFCHDGVTNNQRATMILPAAAAGTQVKVDQSIQLSVMIHKIHLGDASQQGLPYYDYTGNPLTPASYPGNLMDCAQCHVTPTSPTTSVWGLPINAAVYPTSTSTSYSCTSTGCTQTGTTQTTREAAVCGSCHDSALDQAHMQQNVVSGTETCDLCHGLYTEADVRKVHVPNP